MWYDKAFDADKRSEILAGDSVETFGRYWQNAQETTAQPTTLEEALRVARELGRIPEHDCHHSSQGEDGCDCDLLREKLEHEAWKDKL